MKIPDKIILDACCSSKMFWFDKNHPLVTFQDIREVDTIFVGLGRNGRNYTCKPDIIADFRDMPHASGSFKLVVFDPPHLKNAGKKSFMAIKYGKLDPKTWKDDLKMGFSECFRVLQDYGVLIFKWNEYQIPIKDVLSLTDQKPLFGHISGKQSKTHWICFMKIPNLAQ